MADNVGINESSLYLCHIFKIFIILNFNALSAESDFFLFMVVFVIITKHKHNKDQNIGQYVKPKNILKY